MLMRMVEVVMMEREVVVVDGEEDGVQTCADAGDTVQFYRMRSMYLYVL